MRHLSFVGLLLMILFLVVSCTSSVQKKVPATKQEDACSIYLLLDTGEANKCYRDAGIATKNPSLCDKIEHPPLETECFYWVGVGLNDSDSCTKIPNPFWKEGCLLKVGLATKEISVCDLLQTSSAKENCLFNIGKDKKDINICDKLSSPSNWRCYTEIAVAKKDPPLCGQISSEVFKDACYNKLTESNQS